MRRQVFRDDSPDDQIVGQLGDQGQTALDCVRRQPPTVFDERFVRSPNTRNGPRRELSYAVDGGSGQTIGPTPPATESAFS